MTNGAMKYYEIRFLLCFAAFLLDNIILGRNYSKTEYRFAIVDGQGRYLIAPKKGMDRLNAIILMDAPDDLNERLKFEAELVHSAKGKR